VAPELRFIPPFFQDNALLLWLIWHRHQGVLSPWKTYIETLPKNVSFLPAYWDFTTRIRLSISPQHKMYRYLPGLKIIIEYLGRIVATMFLKAGLTQLGVNMFLRDEYAQLQWAVGVLTSRSLRLRDQTRLLLMGAGPQLMRPKYGALFPRIKFDGSREDSNGAGIRHPYCHPEERRGATKWRRAALVGTLTDDERRYFWTLALRRTSSC